MHEGGDIGTGYHGIGRFEYVRMRGEHLRKKQANEQRHRGGVSPGGSRESGSLGKGSGKREGAGNKVRKGA